MGSYGYRGGGARCVLGRCGFYVFLLEIAIHRVWCKDFFFFLIYIEFIMPCVSYVVCILLHVYRGC